MDPGPNYRIKIKVKNPSNNLDLLSKVYLCKHKVFVRCSVIMLSYMILLSRCGSPFFFVFVIVCASRWFWCCCCLRCVLFSFFSPHSLACVLGAGTAVALACCDPQMRRSSLFPPLGCGCSSPAVPCITGKACMEPFLGRIAH